MSASAEWLLAILFVSTWLLCGAFGTYIYTIANKKNKERKGEALARTPIKGYQIIGNYFLGLVTLLFSIEAMIVLAKE